MTQERQLISINIKEENGKQTVSARELHDKLGVESKFMDWFNRMLKYGFEENVDYVLVAQKKETNNPKNPLTTGKVTPFKSVKQCYDLFIKPLKLMGYRKFRDSTKQNQIKVAGEKSEYLIESIPCNNATSRDDSDLCSVIRIGTDVP